MSLLRDIWFSARSLPLWVQIWVIFILGPVNLASVFFWAEPFGKAVAILAIGGIAPNLILVIVQRGITKAMSISHLIFWLPLILLLLGMVTGSLNLSPAFGVFIWILLLVDAASYVFDVQDSFKYWQGDRAVSGF